MFSRTTALVARWFVKNRGLALGIVASGSGLGTFLIVPGAERLVAAFDWNGAFFTCGIAAGAIMLLGASFLKPPPEELTSTASSPQGSGTSVGQALRDPRLYFIMAGFMLFFLGIQIVMVHLVNDATDQGIDPLVAASFVSVIGISSVAGRLTIGVLADKTGIHLSMVITRVFLVTSFVLLLFTHAVWAFFVFAVLFSIPYGGEVTQIPLVIGRYFGTKAMATLMGLTIFVNGLGGALGPWLAGKIYDTTGSYTWAFITGAISGLGSIIMVWALKRKDAVKSGT